mmetsp:Transcript_50645/g.91162  ORF Transcript_50645/g.91162 Transcript_50645/m.91162 type:complete len:223 (-) Transcript_50645:374-1042(-)
MKSALLRTQGLRRPQPLAARSITSRSHSESATYSLHAVASAEGSAEAGAARSITLRSHLEDPSQSSLRTLEEGVAFAVVVVAVFVVEAAATGVASWRPVELLSSSTPTPAPAEVPSLAPAVAERETSAGHSSNASAGTPALQARSDLPALPEKRHQGVFLLEFPKASMDLSGASAEASAGAAEKIADQVAACSRKPASLEGEVKRQAAKPDSKSGRAANLAS